jgi:hypothetical protein
MQKILAEVRRICDPSGMNDKCYACDRPLGKNPLLVDTRDGHSRVKAAGDVGYQPPKGGPRLYPMPDQKT